MNFELTEEQRMLIESLSSTAKREDFKKLAVEIDRGREFPRELMKKYAELGVLGMTLSPDHGGSGRPGIDAILCVEELAKFSPVLAMPVFESNIGPVRVIDTFGTEETETGHHPRCLLRRAERLGFHDRAGGGIRPHVSSHDRGRRRR